jgi:hypothetical protein
MNHRKGTVTEQQVALQTWIEERLQTEPEVIRQRAYEWLTNNHYFLDNELFDFYFSVAQNIAAVEALNRSDVSLLQAKREMEQAANAVASQIVEASDRAVEHIDTQIQKVNQSQDNLGQKLEDVLAQLVTERQNLQTISTGLVSTSSTLLKEQKKVVTHVEKVREMALTAVGWGYAIPIMALVSWGAVAFTLGKVQEYDSAASVQYRVLASQTIRVQEICLNRYLENPNQFRVDDAGVIKNCPGFEYRIPANQRKGGS